MQRILECKQCGANLEIAEESKIVKCRFCGSVNTVSYIDRLGLYNRANSLRRSNEFDRALGVYEDILKEDDQDAEAYYGIALCKYGIEYVEDPNGSGRIPTCHRTRYTPMSLDKDFKMAVKYADEETAALYQSEAARIDSIIKKILALSANEEKYDIFICYKEGDEAGGRTRSSVLAQDIYNELIKHGYKVFFARKTLEQKLGSDYEPIIFAALYSAKVMLTVGTQPDEFQSVWVRNEWERYRERLANGEECTLIPLYRDMSPYDMPEEFVNLQSLDMGKIGFMQDLLDGIQKLIRRNTVQPVASYGNAAPQDSIETLKHNLKTKYLGYKETITKYVDEKKQARKESFLARVLHAMVYIALFFTYLLIYGIIEIVAPMPETTMNVVLILLVFTSIEFIIEFVINFVCKFKPKIPAPLLFWVSAGWCSRILFNAKGMVFPIWIILVGGCIIWWLSKWLSKRISNKKVEKIARLAASKAKKLQFWKKKE